MQLCASFLPAVDRADAGIFVALLAYKTLGSVFDWSFLVSAGLGAVVELMRGRHGNCDSCMSSLDSLFIPVWPPHFWWPLHVLVRCPSLGLHSHLCAELTPCGRYAMAPLLPTAFRTPQHYLCAMKMIDVLR